MKTASTTLFRVSDYVDIYRANNACSTWARQFTVAAGLGHSYDAPRLFVSFDRAENAYRVEPNEVFLPANLAWQYLCECEGNP